ncbi:helix-turn-helix domain-containing protein [Sinorhizobium meliloti]|nr:helix-turn-helix domain-containing protein [Sinorhizobium meliloti]
MLRAIISHYANDRGRPPQAGLRLMKPSFDWRNNISTASRKSISITDITTACGSSRRTFYRAFLEVLGDTPNHYLRRLPLHRIRRDLMAGDQLRQYRQAAKKWGIAEHGRMSAGIRSFRREAQRNRAAQSRRAFPGPGFEIGKKRIAAHRRGGA